MLQDEDDLRLCVTTKMYSSYVGGYEYGTEYTSMCCHKTYLALHIFSKLFHKTVNMKWKHDYKTTQNKSQWIKNNASVPQELWDRWLSSGLGPTKSL